MTGMSRTARVARAGYCYHLMNRGNGRAEVFHDETDYNAFARVPLRPIAGCLMLNHFPAVAWPSAEDPIAHYMVWLLTTPMRSYRRKRKGVTSGDRGELKRWLRRAFRNSGDGRPTRHSPCGGAAFIYA
jgi:putative transposase